jgi:GxxExxY protein
VGYRGVFLDCAYRMDLVVEGVLLVELKSVEQLLPIHEAQVITYLKLSALEVGPLINLNALSIRQGIRRLRRGRVPCLRD